MTHGKPIEFLYNNYIYCLSYIKYTNLKPSIPSPMQCLYTNEAKKKTFYIICVIYYTLDIEKCGTVYYMNV